MMFTAGMLLQRAVAQSVLHPAGPQSARILRLFGFAVGAATFMYLLTVGALAFASWSARKRGAGEQPGTGDGRMAHEREHAERKNVENAQRRVQEERTMTRAVSSGMVLTVLVLLVFLTYDLSVGRAMTPAPGRNPLVVELTGTQWWWSVEYPGEKPQDRISTANEIHVPVGEPVVLTLSSKDVIHSVWVPNLAGKKDLVPGYVQSAWFQADTAGVYRGQCAEFCGHQHAKMGLVVIAEPRAQFDAWQTAARQPQAPPTDSLAIAGQTVFMTGTCAMCHTIDGTQAGSRNGPNLTHLATRRTIAAATLENTRENLAKWITDPQGVKPGTRMPPSRLTPAELDALVSYLQSLK